MVYKIPPHNIYKKPSQVRAFTATGSTTTIPHPMTKLHIMAKTAYFLKSMALKIMAIIAKDHSTIKIPHPIVELIFLMEQIDIGLYVPAIIIYMAQ